MLSLAVGKCIGVDSRVSLLNFTVLFTTLCMGQHLTLGVRPQLPLLWNGVWMACLAAAGASRAALDIQVCSVLKKNYFRWIVQHRNVCNICGSEEGKYAFNAELYPSQ